MNVKILPLGNVVKSSDQAYQWEATNGDPQFEFQEWQRLAGRRVEINFRVLSRDPIISPIKIYPDSGEGLTESSAITLELFENGIVSQEIVFPANLKGLRFDPLSHKGFFSILDMKIKLLPAKDSFYISTLKKINKKLFKKNVAVTTNSLANSRSYQAWITAHEPRRDEILKIRQLSEKSESDPLISILMPTYNTPGKYLKEAIESVKNQIYGNWELCIADDFSTDTELKEKLIAYEKSDPRIKVVFRSENGHISAASNSALELATGSYIALLDHDDVLHPLALYCVAEVINKNPDVALIYTDEDKIAEDGSRSDPYFKCSFNYDLMLGQNMICHFGVYNAEVMRSIGSFREGFEGAQDYDLALRVLDHAGEAKIKHIPRVLYHWRLHALSTSASHESKPYAQVSALRAIAEHLDRKGVVGTVRQAPSQNGFNQVCYALPAILPSVEIIIPTRDAAKLVRQCIESIVEKTDYKNYSITIIDNGSVEEATFELFDEIKSDSRIRVVRDELPFNYSALNNRIALASQADFVCLMNNDIEVINDNWLSEMVSLAIQPNVGCVGAKLLYPDGGLQHGGVIIGVGGVAGHSHKRFPGSSPGYFARAVLRSSMSAVTAACLVVRQTIFKDVGGLDEKLQIAFNDVDFCLRVKNQGYRNIWTPYAELYHHESATRGYEDTPEKISRFNSEVDYIKSRWGESLLRDPCYSPNLTLESEDFAYAWPPRVENIMVK
ncbi:glycosyltransferase family 2 protein [Actimicrobium sp. CCC2.4]|uniref:glycosyltransferase family 2 protein n=1 Tax=Actimicrobium sp. CCC2.4 TaxID=3048606 RepID=UPI002AC986E4|nr:glycosyltransferase family 2 protein [Actimicrobium sp. CCC2.4]MEB0136047.1 glycosyltransferase family 2 protein [Actimicrobium sp. CCC2.4]WPX32195.1 glycosyltransferase family 2 protein [Actimicrobium sp. CCC2.4]